MNWTKEMLDAVKGNERPFGLAKTCWVEGRWTIADLIEAAYKEGADIDVYGCSGWSPSSHPYWSQTNAYRVSPSWTPAHGSQWCMCTELKAVARDGWSTCSICGGQDAYGKNPKRPQDKRKVLSPLDCAYEVERCVVFEDNRRLSYRRQGCCLAAVGSAVNDPDFIAYEYIPGVRSELSRLFLPQANLNAPAEIPVAVLFRRELKS